VILVVDEIPSDGRVTIGYDIVFSYNKKDRVSTRTPSIVDVLDTVIKATFC
jgi:hypothetical protein